MSKGIQFIATDTHLDVLLSFSSHSQYLAYPMMSQCLSASLVSSPYQNSSQHPPHIPAVLPSFPVPRLSLPESTIILLLAVFFSSLAPLGLPVFQVFPPLITPTCIIKIRHFLKRSGAGGGWEALSGNKRLDYFNLTRWKIQIFIIFFFHLCHWNNHTPLYIISKCDKSLG